MKYLLVCFILAVFFVSGCDNLMGKDSAEKRSDVPLAVYGSL